jgi:hypothetical protein
VIPRTTPTRSAASTTPQTTQPADYNDDKCDRNDFGAMPRMHDCDWSKERTGNRRHSDAKHNNCGHVGLQSDSERCDHVRPLNQRHNTSMAFLKEQPYTEAAATGLTQHQSVTKT